MSIDLSRRRLNRRRIIGGSIAAAGGLTMARGTGASASRVGRVGAQESTEITFWFFNEWVEAAVTAFNEQTPSISVELQQLGYGDVHNKLLTSLAAGSGAPDVVGIELGYAGTFSSQGGMADLNQAPFNAGELVPDLVDYKVQQGSTADGKLVLFPWDIAPGGLFYRADLLEEAGIDPDPAAVQARVTSWDAWFALGDEIKQKNADRTLLADAIRGVFTPQVEQQGHGWFDGAKVVIEENATAPLQAAMAARERGLDLELDEGSPEWAAAFRENTFVGSASACWAEGNLRREQPQTVGQWRAIRPPGPGFNIGGSFLAIPEQSEKKEAAWEFIKFLAATTEGALIGLREGAAFPSYRPAWTDPVFDQPVDFFGGQPAHRLWLDIAQEVPGRPIHPSDRQAEDIVNSEIALVEQEGKDSAAAMTDAEAEVLERVGGSTP